MVQKNVLILVTQMFEPNKTNRTFITNLNGKQISLRFYHTVMPTMIPKPDIFC